MFFKCSPVLSIATESYSGVGSFMEINPLTDEYENKTSLFKSKGRSAAPS